MSDWTRQDLQKAAGMFAAERMQMGTGHTGRQSMGNHDAQVQGMREALTEALEFIKADVTTQAERYPEMVKRIEGALKETR